MKQVLRINMSDLTVSKESIDAADPIIGGRGLGDLILSLEVNPQAHPLGPANKLVIAPGSLAKAQISSTGRVSFIAKSPLTGGIKESNAGGMAGYGLARLGIDALIVEGQSLPQNLHFLILSENEARLVPADDFRGMGNYELSQKLRQIYGSRIVTISIGPIGERCLAAAAINCSDMDGDPSRVAARGGLGAVMGSKGLKAVVIRYGDMPQSQMDREKLKRWTKEYSRLLRENHFTGTIMPTYGTSSSVEVVNALGGLPTRNFSQGSFSDAKMLGGEALKSLVERRGGPGKLGKPCMPGCIIRCSNIIADESGQEIVRALEYETIGMFGPNLGINDLDAIARLNRICNDLGLDTIEMGASIGVAMEAGRLDFSDVQGVFSLMTEIAAGSELGRILASGAAVVGKVFGVKRAPVVKEQAISAYDPRAIKALGVTYATSPQGADHTAGFPGLNRSDYHQVEGQVEVSRKSQIERAAIDSLGLCVFALAPLSGARELLWNLVSTIINDENLPKDFVEDMGQKVLTWETDFNLKAGISSGADHLPEFFLKEKLPPYDLIFDVPLESGQRRGTSNN